MVGYALPERHAGCEARKGCGAGIGAGLPDRQVTTQKRRVDENRISVWAVSVFRIRCHRGGVPAGAEARTDATRSAKALSRKQGTGSGCSGFIDGKRRISFTQQNRRRGSRRAFGSARFAYGDWNHNGRPAVGVAVEHGVLSWKRSSRYGR